jgi:ribosome-associated heat shock protein Hsp15
LSATAERATEPQASQRIDRFLWFARLARSRSQAQAICEAGHIRIDGRRIDRAHAPVRVGDVLALPLHGRVRVIRIEALPRRRGPASEAASLYKEILFQPAVDEDGSRE